MIKRTLDNLVSLPYAVEILTEQLADGSWASIAAHPELPHFMGQGRTPEEATADLSSARREWIPVMLDPGRPVPQPAALATAETVY